jgi:FecR protein
MCSTDRLQHYRDAGTAARSSRLLLTPYTGRNRNVVTSGETGLLRVHTMLRLLFSLIVLAFIAGAPALAQQQPPARVGRVSFISGNLALHTAGQSEWSAGTVNYPVGAGTSLWTDAEARAEIRLAPNTIDMGGNTALDVAALDERVTRLSLPQGRIYLHLRRLDGGQGVEVDIPRGAIQLLEPGYYDIDAGTQDQPARIAVFEGDARFVGGSADIAVKAGDVAVLNGISPVTATLERAVADAFVEWCRSRDYDEKRLAAPYHVSPNMTGYVELDTYGRWDSAPGYGEVWYPNVPAGWQPYTDGRWTWVEPWGWTWIDAQPWGFAPCHYGRWTSIGGSWGWVPGAFEPFPVYAPALVAFLGGPGVGLYFAGTVGPQVGWFPLAPGEIYWPSYASDASYIRALNRPNVAGIDSIHIPRDGVPPAELAHAAFVNRRFATVVPQHVFAGAGKVDASALHPAASALEHTPVTMRPPQVRQSTARGVPGPAAFGPRGQPAASAGMQRVPVATSGPVSRRGAAGYGASSHASIPQLSGGPRQRSAAGLPGRWPGTTPHQPPPGFGGGRAPHGHPAAAFAGGRAPHGHPPAAFAGGPPSHGGPPPGSGGGHAPHGGPGGGASRGGPSPAHAGGPPPARAGGGQPPHGGAAPSHAGKG